MPRMKSYASFDAYLDDQDASNAALIRILRRLVRRVAPSLIESVKWGNGCWIGKTGPVAYVYSGKDHVQFGFFMGAKLNDSKRLLQGSGKFVRHTKIRTRSDIREGDLSTLLRQAVRTRYGASRP